MAILGSQGLGPRKKSEISNFRFLGFGLQIRRKRVFGLLEAQSAQNEVSGGFWAESEKSKIFDFWGPSAYMGAGQELGLFKRKIAVFAVWSARPHF